MKNSLTYFLLGLAVLVIAMLGIKTNEYKNQVSELKSQISMLNEQITSTIPNIALQPNIERLSINKLDSNQTEIINSAFKYKLLFPSNRYNIWSHGNNEIIVMDPGNKGPTFRIRATIKDQPFSTYDAQDAEGYPTTQNCTKSNATLAGQAATKYVCENRASIYYLVEKGDYHYAIETDGEAKFSNDTETFLKGLEFTK